MKLIRKILVKILGVKGYLRLISRIYIGMIRRGMLKDKYPEIHHLSELLKPGMTVVDIGANLGYYSSKMADEVGVGGKVIAIEPIPLFAEIFSKNCKRYKQIHLHNVALGTEQKKVKMAIPVVNGLVRHGLTQVVDEKHDTKNKTELSFDVEMINGDELMQSLQLEKIDYIKCDVEGYEQFVIPAMEATIDQYRPFLQIELGGKENRKNVVTFLKNKGYDVFILENQKLQPIEESKLFSYTQDFYFKPSGKNVES